MLFIKVEEKLLTPEVKISRDLTKYLLLAFNAALAHCVDSFSVL